MQKYMKAIVALVSPTVLGFLTPEVIEQLALNLSQQTAEYVTLAITAVGTALIVYFTPNKE